MCTDDVHFTREWIWLQCNIQTWKREALCQSPGHVFFSYKWAFLEMRSKLLHQQFGIGFEKHLWFLAEIDLSIKLFFFNWNFSFYFFKWQMLPYWLRIMYHTLFYWQLWWSHLSHYLYFHNEHIDCKACNGGFEIILVIVETVYHIWRLKINAVPNHQKLMVYKE